MRFERGASNTFTIPARPTTSPSNWLLRFVKVDGGLEVLCIADAYAVTGMPVQLTFTEVDSAPSATDGEVTLSLGQWHLYVYEQASASNLNYTLATRQPFDTLVEVVGAAVPDPPPTNPCSGEGDPVTIRTTDGLTEIDTALPGTNYDLPQSHIKYTETDGISENTLDAFDTQYQDGDDMLYPDVVIPARRVLNSEGNPANSARITLKDLVDGLGPTHAAIDSTVQLNSTTIGNVPANATGNFDVLNSADAPVGSLDVDKWRIADGAVQLKDSADNNIGSPTAVPAEGSVNVTAPDASVQLKDSAGNNIGSPDSYRSNSSNNKTAPDGAVNVVDNNGDPLTSATVRSGATATAVVTDWEGEFPAITPNTPSYNDEGDSTTGWTNSGATLAVTSSVLRFTMTTSGVAATVSRAVSEPVAGKDWVVYGKVKAGFTAVGSQVIALKGSGTLAIDLRWNFNTVTNVQSTGTLSMRYTNAAGTTTNLVLKTGGSFSSNWTDFALQYDSLNQKFAVHERDANGWAFLGHIEGSFAITTLEVRLGSAAGTSFLEWDFLTLVAPNIQSIGDSLTRGSTLFSPIVSMGLNNGDSQWQRWARLYPSLRNNLIINKGIGGNTTAMVAARIQADVLDNLPKLVMLSVCNNDYSAPINLADRTTNIQNSINLCGVAGVPVIIYNATYGTPDEARQPNHRLFYLEWWNDYRPTLTGVQGSINIMGGMREPGGYADNLLTQTDGIHPNVTGYGRMGRWIEALPYA